METRKLTDSMNALRPASPLLPLDANTEDAPVCPPSWPSCGTEPGAKDPAPTAPERAEPTVQ